MNIRPISVAEMREHAGPLLRAHWRELEASQRLLVLDPDWPTYERLEATGNLPAIAVHDDHGRMVGYSLSILNPAHLHYRSLRYVQNDVMFVAPEHRKAGVGVRLIQATEAEARAAGAKMMLWHAKPNSPLERIMRRGYAVQETIYSKEL